jgi:hypothetical protein
LVFWRFWRGWILEGNESRNENWEDLDFPGPLVAIMYHVVRDGKPIKTNTKVYTSIEEVISDYESKDNVNSLVFYNRVITFPINVGRNGTIELGLTKESPSNDMELLSDPVTFYGVERNIFLKTPDLVTIMDKWTKLGLAYSEEIGKISEFIKNGGYKWVSYSRETSPPLPKVYLSDRFYDRDLVERLKSAMLNLGERVLSSFIEEAYRWTEKKFGFFELLIEGRMRKKVEFDFDLDEKEESFIDKAKRVDELFQEFGNLFSWAHDAGEWLIAIFGESGKGGRSGSGKRDIAYDKREITPNYDETVLVFHDNKITNKFLDEERERHEKVGVLSLYPEIFLIPGEGEPYGLSTPCSKPEVIEVGIVLLGLRKVGTTRPTYEMLFFPFAATKTEVAMGLFKYARKEEHDSRTRRYYPVLMAYGSEASKSEKPEFQILSFSQGPTISLVCDYFEYNEKEENIYSPLVEYASSSSEGETSVKARRMFVAKMNKARKVYKKGEEGEEGEEKRKKRDWVSYVIKKTLNTIDIPYIIEIQAGADIDLTERSKVSEMIAFAKELVKVARKDREDYDIVLKNPFDVKRDKWMDEITKEICYSGSDGKKVYIMATGGFTENEKNLLRMGASIGGNLDIDIYGEGLYPEGVKNLYDVILTSFRVLSHKDGGSLASVLEEASKLSEKIRKEYKIHTEQREAEEGEEENKVDTTKLKNLLLKNPDKAVGYAIARMAKLLLPKIGEAIEKSKGPKITLLFEYSPRIRLKFYPDIKEYEDGGEEIIEDPEILFSKGYPPDSVEINSALKSAVIFLDFKEEGLRVASVNAFG